MIKPDEDRMDRMRDIAEAWGEVANTAILIFGAAVMATLLVLLIHFGTRIW